MNEHVAERDDALMGRQPRKGCVIDLAKARQRFTDDLELSLDRGPEQWIVEILPGRAAGGELPDHVSRAAGIIERRLSLKPHTEASAAA
jgi:hypothetical protein